jgi:hypothetical protein
MGPHGKVKAEQQAVLALLYEKDVVTIEEMGQVVRPRYIYKTICALRLKKNFPIKAQRKGRKVVSYSLQQTGSATA